MTINQTNPSAVFIWASLGGGHKTAKDAIQEQLKKKYEKKGKKLDTSADYDITGEKILSSVTIPFLGKLGKIGADAWNNAQKAGNLRALRRIAALDAIVEFLLYPLIYFRVKHLLMQMGQEPKHLISTQAFGLKAIASATAAVNRQKGWNMHWDVYLTDLPSKRATHFFPSIRRAVKNENLRKLITLHAPHPLVKPGTSEKDFWEKYCGKVTVKTTNTFPIRQAFMETKKLGKELSSPSTTIKMKLNNEKESAILDCGKKSEDAKTYNIPIKKEDKVGFLMLGSVPTTESVRAWLHTFVQAAPKMGGPQPYFFLYCGAPEKADAKNPLLQNITKEIEDLRKQGSLPENVHIIPFTNQDADFIALLMARSDLTITRSGGATSMELLQLRQSKDIPQRKDRCTFIHSEALSRPKDQASYADLSSRLEKLLPSIPDQTKGVKLTEEDWKSISKEIEKSSKQMGISSKAASRIIIMIKDAYKGKPVTQETMKGVIQTFEASTGTLSGQAIVRERKIEKKAEDLARKGKYLHASHEELRKKAIEALLRDEGIVLWESKNAKYLQEKLHAEVVNPEFAQESLREKFFGIAS
jgi:hypothetical protein